MHLFQSNFSECKWVLNYLSEWVRHQLKITDVVTTSPPTASALLSAHTIVVLTTAQPKVTLSNREAQEKNADKATQETTFEVASEGVSEHVEEATAEENDYKATECIKKNLEPVRSRKWCRLLKDSLHLAELCLSSEHRELREYAMIFLLTVCEYSESLKSFLPANLFTTVWNVLSHSDLIVADSDSFLSSQVSLKPLLLFASPEEYTELLKDLLKQTQVNDSNLAYTLKLWQVVINSKVYGDSGSRKKEAVEHLTFILVNRVGCQGAHEDPLLVPLMESLKELINSGIDFHEGVMASILTPCTVIQLQNLPVQQFQLVSYVYNFI